jgi:membrane-associated phospholipid phosphatase
MGFTIASPARLFSEVLLVTFSLVCPMEVFPQDVKLDGNNSSLPTFVLESPQSLTGLRAFSQQELLLASERHAALAATQSATVKGQDQLSTAESCTVRGFARDAWNETSHFAHGLKSAPRGIVRPSNLKWELPIAAATGVLIAEADRPADRRIQSKPFQQTAGQWSNIGLFLELGSGTIAYAVGCGTHRSYLRDTGFKALAAMGFAGASDLALKLTFDRQYPGPRSAGKFWGGGRSFPSGHSATSFAFAAVVAHRYPHNKWLKWSAYALASGVSLSRYPAKKHYLSDILVGATLGYVTGTYVGEH